MKKKPKWCKYCLKNGVKTNASNFDMCSAHYQRIIRNPNISESDMSKPIGGLHVAPRLVGKEDATSIEIRELRQRNRELMQELRDQIDKQVFDRRYQEFIGEAASRPNTPPSWTIQLGKHADSSAMPTVSLGDMHFDEYINPNAVQNLNGYDRAIAEKRLRNFFERTADVAFNYLKGFTYPGIVLAMPGDNFSGDIHEELKQTNIAPMLSSLLYWVSPMVKGIRFFADVFGKVYIVAVVGNHGRRTKKPPHKLKVRNNFDWLWLQLVAKELQDDKRITFNISESADFLFREYNTTYCLTHGDQAKGGTGIAAQWSPLMLLMHRKLKRLQFDYMICGHFHQLGQFMRIRVNGTLRGYDEFSYDQNYEYQPPLQDFWLTDPRRGVICEFPIYVMSRNEPWQTPRPEPTEPYSSSSLSFKRT